MALPPAPPRLANQPDAGSFTGPGASTGPSVDPSAGASPAPPTADPEALEDQNNIRNIIASARILGMKYPGAVPAVQAINSAVNDLVNAIMQVQQPPETPAPPQ